MLKYEIIKDREDENYGRIRALIDFGNVRKGDIGGKIDNYANLSQEDNCWIYHNAQVRDDAFVYGDAMIFGNAMVFGNAEVFGNAWVYGNAEVCGDTWVSGTDEVYEHFKG